jgi:DNA-binding NarL/FixJ family response regulator
MPPPKSASIVLVDDHPAMLRQTLQLLEPHFEIMRTVPHGSEVESVVARLQPDLVLLDITLPGSNGIEIATRLACYSRPPKIVFLTVHEDGDYSRAALATGAFGYVVKSRLVSDLIPALEAALLGKRFISPIPALAATESDPPNPSENPGGRSAR